MRFERAKGLVVRGEVIPDIRVFVKGNAEVGDLD